MAQLVKNPPAHAEDTRDENAIPGSGRSSGEGNGNPLQDSCLGNPMGRAWRAAIHAAAKSKIRLRAHSGRGHDPRDGVVSFQQ